MYKRYKLVNFFTLTATVLLAMSKVHASSFLDKSSIATYWGQNSKGTADSQGSLASYCDDDNTDVLIMSFVLDFKDGNLPLLNLASACDGPVFPGTTLLQCTKVGEDIKTCQDKGKTILMSLGGANGAYGFSNDANAEAFADTLWNLFGAGKSETRPFGDAVLDGFDLDIEAGGSGGYTAMVKRLRENFAKDSSKDYYITAAPQCPYPDAMLGPVLDAAAFDFVNVQFYNNPFCSPAGDSFNFESWDKWAKSSKNSKVKIFLGIPGSSAAAGTGYIKFDTLEPLVKKLKSTYSNFGGVTLWDASASYANTDTSPNYQSAIAGLVHGLSGGATEEGVVNDGGTTSNTTAPTNDGGVNEGGVNEGGVNEGGTVSNITESTNETITDGSECSPNGKLACSGDSFGTCVYDKWVIRSCGSSNTCFPTVDGSSIYCAPLESSSLSTKESTVEKVSLSASASLESSKNADESNKKGPSTSSMAETGYTSKALVHGKPCEPEGMMGCSGDKVSYGICYEKKWLLYACGPPWFCEPTMNNRAVHCYFDQSNVTTKRSSLYVEDASSQKNSATSFEAIESAVKYSIPLIVLLSLLLRNL